MLRVSNLSPIASPALSALKLSFIPSLSLSSSPSSFQLHKLTTFAPILNSIPQKTLTPKFLSVLFNRVPSMVSPPCAQASFSSGSSVEGPTERLVQHLLVKENDVKLLSEIQQRIVGGEDLSDLAVEYSICPSKQEGGMLGWVGKGQMVPEFEEAAFSAPLNKVVKCKTQFGWHLLQVISEREQPLLQVIEPDQLYEKMQDPTFLDEAQLIDVREPDEVAKASLPGFQVLPLRQFGTWGPEITTKFDPEKDTYVMCHHGIRSLQIANWLQTQGFRKVFNVSGGIHEYAVKVDPSIPTY